MSAVNLFQVSRPSIWHRLGFRYRWDEEIFEWRNSELPGLVVSAITTRVRCHISLLDRLRLLISGNCEVSVYTKTNVIVDHAVSRSQFAVLPPGSAER